MGMEEGRENKGEGDKLKDNLGRVERVPISPS